MQRPNGRCETDQHSPGHLTGTASSRTPGCWPSVMAPRSRHLLNLGDSSTTLNVNTCAAQQRAHRRRRHYHSIHRRRRPAILGLGANLFAVHGVPDLTAQRSRGSPATFNANDSLPCGDSLDHVRVAIPAGRIACQAGRDLVPGTVATGPAQVRHNSTSSRCLGHQTPTRFWHSGCPRWRVWRRCRCTARRSTLCASSSIRNALAPRASASTRSATAIAERQRQFAHRLLCGTDQAYAVQSEGQLQRRSRFRPLIVAYRNGAPVRLGDLGNVVDSVQNTKSASWFNGNARDRPRHPAPAGTNTVEVADAVKALRRAAAAQLPPR